MRYLTIYYLLAESKLEEAFREIEFINERDFLLEKQVLLANYYLLQNNYTKASELLDQLKSDVIENGDNRLILAYHTLRLYTYYRMQNLQPIENEIETGNKVLNGILYEMEFNKGNYWIETSNIWVGTYYNILAIIRKNKGLITLAIDFYEMSLSYRKKLKNKIYVGMTLNNLGSVYLDKGEFDQAKSYFAQAYEYVNPMSLSMLSLALKSNLGIINYYTGDMIKAKKYLLELLNNFKQNVLIPFPSLPLLYLTLCYLDEGEMNSAKEIINIMEKVRNSKGLRISELNYNLAQSLYKKAQPRFIQRAEAQIILKKIVDDDIIDVSLTRLAMINLADLLLEEYSIFGGNEALEELQLIIGTLYQIAQQQESNNLIIEVMIFQSKFALLQNNKTTCIGLLSRAGNLAMIYGSEKLVDKIASLKMYVESEETESLISNGDELGTRNKRTELLDYLGDLGPIIKGSKT